VPLCDQPPDDVAADEPAPTDDHDLHDAPFLLLELSRISYEPAARILRRPKSRPWAVVARARAAPNAIEARLLRTREASQARHAIQMRCALRSADEPSRDPFERLMAGDRDIIRGSLDTVSDWRLTRPADVPGQAIGQADYVLIAEIVEVERFEQQGSERVQQLADDLEHLVSSRGMLVVRPVL